MSLVANLDWLLFGFVSSFLVLVIAGLVAVLARRPRISGAAPRHMRHPAGPSWAWVLLGLLVAVCVLVPLAMLIAHLLAPSWTLPPGLAAGALLSLCLLWLFRP